MGRGVGRRSRRLCTAFALVAVAAFAGASRAHAAAQFAPCHGSSGVVCATVMAPLDYSGGTPGQIPLAVEELAPTGTPRGVLLLVAGGPGQPSAGTFDLANEGSIWQSIFPGYTLVAYDNRGTGDSGALSCPGSVPLGAQPAGPFVAQCGDALGPERVFYGTRAHAEDIETVRQALGVDRLFLWGTSYGTKQVLAYALAHPTHVERLLLDSVLPLQGPDPFALDTLAKIPLAIEALCSAGACRAASHDPVGDVERLANRLEVTPLSLGRLGPLDGVAFLQLVVDSDLNPGLRAEIPAAAHAALAGRPAALERLALLDQWDIPLSSGDVNPALLLATTCADGGFPWAEDTAPTARLAPLEAAITALPPGSTGPFGLWAIAIGTAASCLEWPAQPAAPALGGGTFPDVPVLILSGDEDMRTPTAGARAVAARFPQAQVVVVPGVGHSVLTSDSSPCSISAVDDWLDGGTVSSCPRVAPLVAPLAAFPASLATIAGKGVRGRTLTAVVRTLHESEAAWLAASDSGIRGVYGGRLVPTGKLSYRISDYSDVPGVAVTGSVTLERSHSSNSFGGLEIARGKVSVTGSAAAHGSLRLAAGSIAGTLGRRHVATR